MGEKYQVQTNETRTVNFVLDDQTSFTEAVGVAESIFEIKGRLFASTLAKGDGVELIYDNVILEDDRTFSDYGNFYTAIPEAADVEAWLAPYSSPRARGSDSALLPMNSELEEPAATGHIWHLPVFLMLGFLLHVWILIWVPHYVAADD